VQHSNSFVSNIIVMPPLPTTFDDAPNASVASIIPFNDAIYVNSSYHAYAAAQSLTVQQQYAAADSELREDLKTIMRLVEVRLSKTLSLFCIMGCQ
jgi:hypothetical protein